MDDKGKEEKPIAPGKEEDGAVDVDLLGKQYGENDIGVNILLSRTDPTHRINNLRIPWTMTVDELINLIRNKCNHWSNKIGLSIRGTDILHGTTMIAEHLDTLGKCPDILVIDMEDEKLHLPSIPNSGIEYETLHVQFRAPKKHLVSVSAIISAHPSDKIKEVVAEAVRTLLSPDKWSCMTGVHPVGLNQLMNPQLTISDYKRIFDIYEMQLVIDEEILGFSGVFMPVTEYVGDVGNVGDADGFGRIHNVWRRQTVEEPIVKELFVMDDSGNDPNISYDNIKLMMDGGKMYDIMISSATTLFEMVSACLVDAEIRATADECTIRVGNGGLVIRCEFGGALELLSMHRNETLILVVPESHKLSGQRSMASSELDELYGLGASSRRRDKRGSTRAATEIIQTRARAYNAYRYDRNHGIGYEIINVTIRRLGDLYDINLKVYMQPDETVGALRDIVAASLRLTTSEVYLTSTKKEDFVAAADKDSVGSWDLFNQQLCGGIIAVPAALDGKWPDSVVRDLEYAMVA